MGRNNEYTYESAILSEFENWRLWIGMFEPREAESILPLPPFFANPSVDIKKIFFVSAPYFKSKETNSYFRNLATSQMLFPSVSYLIKPLTSGAHQ